MKTAVNILSEKMKLKHDETGSICLTVDSITDAMKEYARQVAEAVRQECAIVAMNEMDSAIGILKIDLDQFIP